MLTGSTTRSATKDDFIAQHRSDLALAQALFQRAGWYGSICLELERIAAIHARDGDGEMAGLVRLCIPEYRRLQERLCDQGEAIIERLTGEWAQICVRSARNTQIGPVG